MGGGIFKSYRNDTVSVVIEVIESSSLFLHCLFTEDKGLTVAGQQQKCYVLGVQEYTYMDFGCCDLQWLK